MPWRPAPCPALPTCVLISSCCPCSQPWPKVRTLGSSVSMALSVQCLVPWLSVALLISCPCPGFCHKTLSNAHFVSAHSALPRWPCALRSLLSLISNFSISPLIPSFFTILNSHLDHFFLLKRNISITRFSFGCSAEQSCALSPHAFREASGQYIIL